MRIKVYQIDDKLDRYNIGFCSYDAVMSIAGKIDPGIYKTVFDGNLDAKDFCFLLLKFEFLSLTFLPRGNQVP